MRLADSVRDGLAELTARPLRTALQTIGVLLGVASLVAVQGLVDAGRRRTIEYLELTGGLTRIGIYEQRAWGPGHSAREMASPGLTLDDARAIREEVPGVRFVDGGFRHLRFAVRGGRGPEQIEVVGATPDYLAVDRSRLARGRFLTDADLASEAHVCVLGSSAAREHFGGADPIGKVLHFGRAGFTVIGVLAREEYQFEGSTRDALEWRNRLVVLPATTMATRLLGGGRDWGGGRLNLLTVAVDRADRLAAAAREIEALLKRRHGGVKDFEVYHVAGWLEAIGERLQVFNVTFLITGAVSLLVGGIVIMNIMLASLHERIREVGLRRACGAGRGDIAVQFLVESLLVAAIGAGGGLLLGTLFTRAVSSFVERPALITPGMAWVSLAAAIAVGLVFGLYPAARAARLNPVEALRYE